MTGLVLMSRITIEALRMLWLGAKVVGCLIGNLDGSAPFKRCLYIAIIGTRSSPNPASTASQTAQHTRLLWHNLAQL